jgi:PPM family protein phosphatase
VADGHGNEAQVHLRAGSATSAGRVRAQNQDRSLIIDDALFIVADGMGGHVGGEVAAQVAVDTFAGLVTTSALRSDDVIARVEAANREILGQAERNPDLRGMGTTITGIALIEGDETTPALLLVLNVGDSRTYWLRGGELEQITEDHSVVGELLREGKLSKTDARTHRSRSVLTRALGVEPDVECDVLEVAPIVGDRFLICSDGLPTELTDPLIAATLRQLRDPQEAASALVREAVDHGGRDNVTVIIVDVVSGVDGHEVAATTLAARAARPTDTITATPLAAAASRTAPPTKSARGPRRPWIVNLRVLLFLGVVAAIVGVVAWTIRNDPAKTPPAETTVVTTTPISLVGPSAPLSTGAPTTLTANGDTSLPTDSAVSATDGPGVVDTAATDPVPGAVVDPFATTTTTTAKPTSTTKPKRSS